MTFSNFLVIDTVTAPPSAPAQPASDPQVAATHRHGVMGSGLTGALTHMGYAMLPLRAKWAGTLPPSSW